MTRNLAWSAAIGGLAALIVPAAAQAFCGTYVGEAGAELTSGASKVVMVRDGNRTVLTLANDVEGSVKDFAVVIPVPEVLSEEDVRVLDPAILDTLRGAWLEVVEEEKAANPNFAKVWESLTEFRAQYEGWSELGYLK